MNMDPWTAWNEVRSHVCETAKLEGALALLEWDDRTYLPSRAGGYRADQTTLLSGMIHRRRTDQRLGELLQSLIASDLVQEPHSPTGASILKLWKDFQRNVRLPVALVEAITKATALGQQSWEAARAANSWAAFEPHMQKIFDLRREEAELLRDEGTLYDTLLDQYEEGARSEVLTSVFAGLRDSLVQLVKDLSGSTKQPNGASWRRSVPLDLQRHSSRWIAERIGYRFDRGRLDETSHPFCTTVGPDDCRILTRYQLDYFPSGFYGTLHEAGHGIYEQGLPSEWYGFPAGAAASLGVHESQSRMWENFVGRSQSFWQWCLPELQSRLRGAWDDISLEQIYRDANLVQPSLIRVEADEVTYNLHILIRFEIEQELISGDLKVSDAPQAWNDRYHQYLGIRPATHADGILQDIHWSAGLIGYFPTYTLGNLYAAQLMEAIQSELGDVATCFSKGDFTPLRDWLIQHVHQFGRCFHPGQLVQNACGRPLEAAPLANYLRQKLEPIYGLA
jgi:carboxypeptidase Taq